MVPVAFFVCLLYRRAGQRFAAAFSGLNASARVWYWERYHFRWTMYIPSNNNNSSFVRLTVSSHNVFVLSSCGALLAISLVRHRFPVFSSAKQPIRLFRFHVVRQYHILDSWCSFGIIVTWPSSQTISCLWDFVCVSIIRIHSDASWNWTTCVG